MTNLRDELEKRSREEKVYVLERQLEASRATVVALENNINKLKTYIRELEERIDNLEGNTLNHF